MIGVYLTEIAGLFAVGAIVIVSLGNWARK
jgi:hypothetical protein